MGILSQGMRIAPPEAPVSGYLFGKGVYFANMVRRSLPLPLCPQSPLVESLTILFCVVVLFFPYQVSKSSNYCRTTKKANIGLMLLSEVALGKM